MNIFINNRSWTWISGSWVSWGISFQLVSRKESWRFFQTTAVTICLGPMVSWKVSVSWKLVRHQAWVTSAPVLVCIWDSNLLRGVCPFLLFATGKPASYFWGVLLLHGLTFHRLRVESFSQSMSIILPNFQLHNFLCTKLFHLMNFKKSECLVYKFLNLNFYCWEPAEEFAHDARSVDVGAWFA